MLISKNGVFIGIFACFFAQLTAQTVLPSDSLQQVLSDVVIQATRIRDNNPIPHNNISAEAIREQYHAQDVPYLLNSVPAVVETSDGGAGIGYTGLRIRGSDQSRINVTLNGVPYNDPESQNVFWVDLPDVATSASEIQVQRGVGTSTNGAGAFGATVNIDLSSISVDPSALVSSTVGSFDTRRQTININTGLMNGKWSFSGRVSTLHSDGFIDRASVDMRAMHFSGAYINNRHSVQIHYLDGQEKTYQAWNGVPVQYFNDPALRTFNTAGTEKPGEPYRNEVDFYVQRHLLAHYKYVFSPTLLLQINGHYTRGYGYYEQYKAAQNLADYPVGWGVISDSLYSDLIRQRWLNNHFGGATWLLNWKPRRQYELSLGGALNTYAGQHYGTVIWAESFSLPERPRHYYHNDARKTDGNVFLKADKTIGKWRVYGDLQYRYINYAFLGFNNLLQQVDQQVNYHFFNPKAGATYQVHPDAQAYIYIGVANREPNRDDFTQSTPESRPQSERLYDLETGLKHKTATWSSNLNLYYMRYNNQLVLDGRINDVGAYTRTNVPNSYRAGIELETAWRINSRILLNGNICGSRNRIKSFTAFVDVWDDGTQQAIQYQRTALSFSPSLTGRIEAICSLTPEHARHQLRCAVIGRYISKQYLDNTSSEYAALPAYQFADFRVNYDWKGSGRHPFSLIFTINNITNSRYANNGWVYRFVSNGYNPVPDDPYSRLEGNNRYNLTGLFPQAGRNYALTVVARL